MKRIIVVSNIILFAGLVVMTYFKLFGLIALVLSLACIILPLLSSGLTKKWPLLVVYTAEAIVGLILFLGNGPFTLDWLLGGTTIFQVMITFVCQIFFVMLVLGIMMKNHARIERACSS